MLVDRGGNLYLTGYADRAGKSSMLTVKLSPAGRVLWKRWYLGPAGISSAGHALAPRSGGGVFVAGLVANASGGFDAVCVAYRSDGSRAVADPVAAGEATVSLEDIAVLKSGTIVGVGWSALHGPTKPFLCVWHTDGHVEVPATMATPFSDATSPSPPTPSAATATRAPTRVRPMPPRSASPATPKTAPSGDGSGVARHPAR